jgi:lipopolysaccharide export system permease protein
VTILRYTSRIFLARFLLCLAGFAALLQLLDLLDNATEALGRGGLLAVGRYALLRLPSTINQLVPISVLLGALATLIGLANHNEIVAMKASGLSLYRILAALVPVTAVVAALHFAMGDQVAPRTERHFQDWWAATPSRGAAKAQGAEPAAPLWMRDHRTLLSVDKVAERGRSLEGLTIFERDAAGNISGRISAARAEYRNGEWILRNTHRVTIVDKAVSPAVSSPEFAWQTALRPRDFVALSTPIDTLSTRALLDIVSGRRPAIAGEAYYETRLQRKFALPVASLVMLLVAAPAAAGLRRHGNASRGLGLGLAVGFVFLIIDGLAVAAGQAGLFPAALAAWSPTLIFGCIGGTALIWLEDKG